MAGGRAAGPSARVANRRGSLRGRPSGSGRAGRRPRLCVGAEAGAVGAGFGHARRVASTTAAGGGVGGDHGLLGAPGDAPGPLAVALACCAPLLTRHGLAGPEPSARTGHSSRVGGRWRTSFRNRPFTAVWAVGVAAMAIT